VEKVIVTDCDGVLLNWEYAFDIWMNEKDHYKVEGSDLEYNIGKRYGISTEKGKEYIKFFNESAAIGFLPALRDAVHYVKLLHEKHGYVFDVVTSLSKNPYAAYEYFWLEDKPENAYHGKLVGMKPILIEHGHNMDNTDFPVAKMWEDVYNIITDPIHKAYGVYGRHAT